MSSIAGKNIKMSIFGESHGKAIGVVIDDIPAGIEIDFDKIRHILNRRAPGKKYTTPRAEKDEFNILSGLKNSVTTGSPLTAIFENKNTKSKDYDRHKIIPRPSHADYTAFVRYDGHSDFSGGGHFSGRLTAPITFAGAIAKQILEKEGIYIGAHLKQIGEIRDEKFDDIDLDKNIFEIISNKDFPVINEDVEIKMKELLAEISQEGDSIGAVLECGVTGIEAGIGNPMFDGIENNLAKNLFAIPGVKAISFGSGFESAKMRGSEHNDEFYYKDNKVKTKTNNSGGIQGGITNGMPIILDIAMKPTASIFIEQNTINLSEEKEEKLLIEGRHDPCIGIRAVPVLEALVAFTLLDFILEKKR